MPNRPTKLTIAAPGADGRFTVSALRPTSWPNALGLVDVRDADDTLVATVRVHRNADARPVQGTVANSYAGRSRQWWTSLCAKAAKAVAT